MKQTLAVFDIDGVLANISWRLHHINKSPTDYETFNKLALKDPIIEPGLRLLRSHRSTHDHIALLSGRFETEKHRLREWLQNHYIYPDLVILRDPNDHGKRPRAEYKLEKLCELDTKYRIVAFYDNSPHIINLVRDKTRIPAYLLQHEEDNGTYTKEYQ